MSRSTIPASSICPNNPETVLGARCSDVATSLTRTSEWFCSVYGSSTWAAGSVSQGKFGTDGGAKRTPQSVYHLGHESGYVLGVRRGALVREDPVLY